MNSERNLSPQMPMGMPPWQFSPASQPAAIDNKRQWSEIWRSIRKRQWSIIGVSLAASVAAGFIAYSMQPVFRSTATVLIESGKAKILSIEEVYGGVTQDREYYQTQVEILRSRDIALRTVLNAKLWNEREFNPRVPRTGFVNWVKDLFSKPPDQPTLTPQQLADATVGKFMGAVSVEPVRLSQLVKVSVEANDPTLAANMANAVAQSYIDADRDSRLHMTQEVNALLQGRMSALREKLSASEQSLQSFREKEGLVNLSGSAQGVTGQTMGDISQQLLVARMKRTELESALSEASKMTATDSVSGPSVMGYPGIGEARARVAAAQLRLDDVSRVFGPNHETVIQAQSELASTQRFLRTQTQSVLSGMRRDVAAARETERALEAALSAAKGNVQGVNRQEFQLGVLERDVQANRQLYELFLSRVKETSISSNLQAAVARVVDTASVSGAPVRPNKAQIVGLSLILSLLATAIGSVLLDAMDNTVRSSDEAEHRLRHQVLTTLPLIVTNDHRSLPRLYLDRPMSSHAEGIRTARSGVLLSSSDMVNRSLLITSTFEGEGKTTISTNLALAHAQTKRTVLIDSNMRDPQIGRRLGLPRSAKGLSDLIAGTSDIRECLHEIPGSSLLVMPAGDGSLNPQDLLLSRRFRDLINSLSSRVEIIVIDSPPINSVSDALIISAIVTDTIYVVKAMQTSYPAARKGIDRLERAGANVLGVVINQALAGAEEGPGSRHAGVESRFAERRGVGGKRRSNGSWGAGLWGGKRSRASNTASAKSNNARRRADREQDEQRRSGVSDSVFAAVVDPAPPPTAT